MDFKYLGLTLGSNFLFLSQKKSPLQHYQSTHGSLPPEYSDKELLVCDRCPKVYISKVSLAAHISNVHDDSKTPKKPGKICHICGKVFKSYIYCEEHILVKHQQKTPHDCDECHRKYGTITILKKHKVS